MCTNLLFLKSRFIFQYSCIDVTCVFIVTCMYEKLNTVLPVLFSCKPHVVIVRKLGNCAEAILFSSDNRNVNNCISVLISSDHSSVAIFALPRYARVWELLTASPGTCRWHSRNSSVKIPSASLYWRRAGTFPGQ